MPVLIGPPNEKGTPILEGSFPAYFILLLLRTLFFLVISSRDPVVTLGSLTFQNVDGKKSSMVLYKNILHFVLRQVLTLQQERYLQNE